MRIKLIFKNITIILIAQCIILIASYVIWYIEQFGINQLFVLPQIISNVIGIVIILTLYFCVGLILHPIKPVIVNILPVSILVILTLIICQYYNVDDGMLFRIMLCYPLKPLIMSTITSSKTIMLPALMLIPTIVILLGMEYKRIRLEIQSRVK